MDVICLNKSRIIRQIKRLAKVANTDKGRSKIVNEFSNKANGFKGDNTLLTQAKKLYRYFIDPKTNKAKKALIGAGLLYFIIPIDIISDFIPGLGYIDDGVAIAYVFALVESELRQYEKPKKNKAKRRIKDITDEVEIINDKKQQLLLEDKN